VQIAQGLGSNSDDIIAHSAVTGMGRETIIEIIAGALFD